MTIPLPQRVRAGGGRCAASRCSRSATSRSSTRGDRRQGRRPRRPLARPGRDGRPRRRERFGQVDAGAGPAAAAARRDHRRQRVPREPRSPRASICSNRRASAQAALARDLHRLSERDERAQPGAPHPRSARRCARRPPRSQPRGETRAAQHAARSRRHPARAAAQLPPRAFGRHAPAGDDRDGTGRRSRGRDHGRADDGAGCRRQREILAQIVELQSRLHFAILFITHDLSLLLEIADRIAVMYAGKLVEVGGAEQIHNRPAHPYTHGLLGRSPASTAPAGSSPGFPARPRTSARCRRVARSCHAAFTPRTDVAGSTCA